MANINIEYESEYDNRTRVKEHPEIFARWDREAAAYREVGRLNGAKFGIVYGPSERQRYDFFPGKNTRPNAPLAMFIHGGWWRSLAPQMFSQMARGLNERGIDVAVPGYDLAPTVRIGDIIDEMRACCLTLWRAHKKRIMVAGHSAGGHLTACLVATEWHKISSEPPTDLVPMGYAISGVFDLAPLLHVSQNQDLKLDDNQIREVAPLTWNVPPQRLLDAVVGADESNEFLRQSRVIVEAWQARGAETRYEAIPGANHFTVIDPLSDPKSAMVARIAHLAERVNVAGL